MIAHCDKIHLCDSCIYSIVDCECHNIEFGYGKGHDNIISCDCFNQGDNKYIVCPVDCNCCNDVT